MRKWLQEFTEKIEIEWNVYIDLPFKLRLQTCGKKKILS